MGVRDPWSYPKFLCGCKRHVEISEISVWVSETRGDIRNFCVNVRGSQYRPKSYVARERENTQSCYHEDLELSDRSRE